MSQINVPASTLHKAIAALAEYLEDEFSPELFSCMDGGTTLDLSAEASSSVPIRPPLASFSSNL